MPDQHMYRVRAASTGWPGAPGLNTFYFLEDATIEAVHATAALDVATRVHAALTGMRDYFKTGWTCEINPDVDLINSDNGELLEALIVDPPAAITGNGGGTGGPQASCICTSLLTSDIVDGRRVRGRDFFGPLALLADPDGTPTDLELAAFQLSMEGLLGGTLTQVPLVVWSRPRGASTGHPTGLGGSAHIVSAVLTKDSFAVLRSRRA